MGPILGLASTFLIVTTDPSGGAFKGHSSLAIAFVAGFAVDLQLTCMIRLVSAFAGTK
jgi:hypothetical protein